MDDEDREMFPLTPNEALRRCRAKIRGLNFPAAPAPKLKTRDIVPIMSLMHFGYVYSREFKQYFLFIDEYSGEDIEQDGHDGRYSVMVVFAIRGSEPVYLDKFNIVLSSPVYSSPSSPWHTFVDDLSFHGDEGSYNRFLEAEWKVYVRENRVACSEEIVVSDSDSDSEAD
jgi:hypothetical protein